MQKITKLNNGERADSTREKINNNFKILQDNLGAINKYIREFSISDWGNNNTLYIPFSAHNCKTPIITVYGVFSNTFQMVMPDVIIDELYNITLKTDLTFAGKVIIA